MRDSWFKRIAAIRLGEYAMVTLSRSKREDWNATADPLERAGDSGSSRVGVVGGAWAFRP
jgi:hypothetical protein